MNDITRNNDAGKPAVAVTGATGMVGSHLVAELLRNGYADITLVVRNEARLAELHKTLKREGIDMETRGGQSGNGAALRTVTAALNNPHELATALQGAEMVFHCAAKVAIGGSNEQDIIQGNVEMTQHVVDACLKSGVRRLVFVSSVASLGEPADGVASADESTAPGTLEGTTGYAASKLLSENEVLRGAYEGLETVIVNPAPILGAGDWRSGSSVIARVLSGGTPFYPCGATSFVDVRDVARAMVMLAGSEKADGQRYILAAGDMPFEELISIANRTIGRRPPRMRIGRNGLSAAQKAVAVFSRLAGREPALTGEMVRILTQRKFYNGQKIARDFGFAYTPLEETVARIINQYRQETNG